VDQEYLATSSAAQFNGRPAGIAIVLAASVMIAFMAHHPVPSPGDVEHFVRELAHHGPSSAIVHGVLIGTMALLLLGFTGLADLIGSNRLSVRAGLIAYSIGFAAMTAAAMSDGFIMPALAAQYVDTPAGDLDSFLATMQMLFLALAAAARLGVVGLSLAVVLWSLTLVWRPGALSAIGALGLVLGIVPIVLLFTGRLPVHFHAMLAFVVSQVIWYFAIGIQLIRRRVLPSHKVASTQTIKF